MQVRFLPLRWACCREEGRESLLKQTHSKLCGAEQAGLRITVSWQYLQTGVVFADEKNKFDEMVEEQGVKILVDPGALMHVVGTQMDFVEDRLK